MRKSKKAFTLIELLVVIAVIAILLAILMPTLRAAKARAMSAVCRAHLHNWGLTFEMYTNDWNGKFMTGYLNSRRDGKYTWINTLRPYYSDNDKIRFCPRADRTPEEGGKMPLAAWDLKNHVIGQSGGWEYIINDRGSYGINWWVTSGNEGHGGVSHTTKWKRADSAGRSRIPVLMDCGFFMARPHITDIPPDTDGSEGWDPLAPNTGLRRICHDRHNVGVNVLFMDGSAEHVKAKELWELKWHRDWNFVQNFDWPLWMN